MDMATNADGRKKVSLAKSAYQEPNCNKSTMLPTHAA